ncbi:hypothetical protein GQ54DRAFT_300670 [Martensiomyces pterosporus]|nr:hypothetical protein GQ54DRAFT_300670 [Martensiomyces pterosporus]
MIPWSWVAATASQILQTHSAGLARTVLLAELESRWHQVASQEILHTETQRTIAPFLLRDNNPPPPTTVFNLRINHMTTIADTNIWLWKVAGAPNHLNLGEAKNGASAPRRRQTADKQLDMFVHQRYYPMIDATEFSGFFSHQRTFYVTGLAMADRAGGSQGQPTFTFLPTTSLTFELHIQANPSLPPAQQQHTDEILLHDVFGVQYVRTKFVQCSTPVFNADQVWCKVSYIGAVEAKYRDSRLAPYLAMECVLEQNDSPVLLTIGFWDNDVSVARMFKQDDYIGLLCPIVKSVGDSSGAAMEVEYGPQTIAFIMCAISESIDGLTSQMSIAPNDLGYLDYRRYAHRVQICQLRPDMINVTMMARITAVSENMPMDADGEKIDRYAIRVDDGSGISDITLWGELGRQASRMLPGQCILLHTYETHEENGAVVINGSKAIGSALFNISTMTSILMSSELRGYSYLISTPQSSNHYVKACVGAMSPLGDNLRDARDRLAATALVHACCGRRLTHSSMPGGSGRLEGSTDSYIFDCACCGVTSIPNDEVVPSYFLLVQIDDGTASLEAKITSTAANAIIGLSPMQFLELPNRQEQLRALARPLGRDFVLSLTSFSEPLSHDRTLRVEAACSADDIGITTK